MTKKSKESEKNVLYLPLKKEWFDMIKSGEKTEEYRSITQYWIKRLTDIESHEHEINTLVMTGQPVPKKEFKSIHFTLGYPKRDDKERNMEFEFKGIEIGKGKEEWGAKNGFEYFIIKIGDRITNE